MSSRQIRKLFGGNSLPTPEDKSEDEYEPLCVVGASSKINRYKGLIENSNSESEHESDLDAPENENQDLDQSSKKKKRKKKKKQQKKAKEQQPNPTTENHEVEDLDEVERSVQEVNALLGSPAPVPSGSGEQPARDPLAEILSINYKHVNVANEMERLFGPEETTRKKRGRQANMNRLLRRAIIVPPNNPPNYPKSGLSMSIIRRENDCTYFAFDHRREYQKIHRNFLQLAKYNPQNLPIAIEAAQNHMHVEGLLESADMMFRYESYSTANTVIEQVIAYMQYVAHPSFNLTNRNVRLEYVYLENRAFHVAVLKYLHLLTNRACHRTALELAKILMNLDPSDPLAVVFIIDTLALRAREHQWLIDAAEYWDKERNAGLLFNMQYSCALAHYHVATKKGEDLEKADELLKSALLRFPYVYLKIMNHASVPIPDSINESLLFKTADTKCSKCLIDLMSLYAKFTCAKWREGGVYEWLTRNVTELVESYNNDKPLQELVKLHASERLILFKGWPDEVLRHMTVIRPMNNLLVEGAVPSVKRWRSADPLPPKEGRSRFGYYNLPDPRASGGRPAASPLFELVASLAPRYELPLMMELQEQGIDPALYIPPLEEDPAIRFEIEGSGSDDDELPPPPPPPEFANPPNPNPNPPRNFASSVGALTGALRLFMDVYEGATNVTYTMEEDTDDDEEYLAGLAEREAYDDQESISESDEGEEYHFTYRNNPM